MKFIFPIALAVVLVTPTLPVSAADMTAAEMTSIQQTLAHILERLEVLKTTQSASVVNTDVQEPVGEVAGDSISIAPAMLYITIDGVMVFTTNTVTSLEDAKATCESYAYARDNYFKRVACAFEGTTIYDYTFIPG